MESDEQFKELHRKLAKLEEKFDSRLGSIEKALNTIAVQQTEINQIRGEVQGLWKKWDELSGPSGTISRIQAHQAQCPRREFEGRFKNASDDLDRHVAWTRWMFGGTGAILAAIIASFIKIMIDLNHMTLEIGKLLK